MAKLPAPLNIVIGIGLLAWSVPLGYKAYDLTYHGIHTEGEITSLRKHQCTSGSKHNKKHYDCYAPTIAFTANGGRTSFEASQSKAEWGYQVGERVAIVYMSANPRETAALDDGLQIWSGAGLAFAVGLGFFAGGLLQLRRDYSV
jgi:hypothetical protein